MECNKHNVNVTMQIMLDWKEGHTDLIDVRAKVPGAAPFYSWNIISNSSREKMEAMFSCADRLYQEYLWFFCTDYFVRTGVSYGFFLAGGRAVGLWISLGNVPG